MLGNFDIPSVDHLREGIDYTIVDWNFAAQAPAPPVPQPPPGQPCPGGTKMIFGLCRRLKSGSGDWASGDDTDKERELRQQAGKEGSSFENNKAVQSGGKKYGWAKKDGKPVIVIWGSVAGTKPKPVAPLATGSQPVATPAATLPRPVA